MESSRFWLAQKKASAATAGENHSFQQETPFNVSNHLKQKRAGRWNNSLCVRQFASALRLPKLPTHSAPYERYACATTAA
jgi:hypothetical protein